MLCAANWLLSLETAPPLLLDGMSIHPLVGHAFVDRTLDALDSADVGDLVLLDVVAAGLGRARATIANLGAKPRLLLQGTSSSMVTMDSSWRCRCCWPRMGRPAPS